ncbi:MAG: hypothetical protein DMENIID0002_11280 [Rickettsia endosymbiont of Sergentomyia squamirostris]|uniref:Tetratricopeptide repeat protein n=1 Tax=Candidatus Tisiphia endosymbiont of Sergentomyia squamirostris TaxID=3113639 RepID=A0AAT9G9I8_9RICK
MSKKKFQLLPQREIKVNLNSLELLPTRKSNKAFIDNICSNAHPEVLMALIKKKMLGTDIELITEYLLVNLCSHQEYKGRQYTYNKSFAKFIEDYANIKISKIHPTNPRITFKKPNDNIVKVISTPNSLNIHQSENIWTSYAEVLLNLHNYKSKDTVIPKDIHCIKKSFLLIIDSIDKNTLFIELFFDFTKVIGSMDQDTLQAIRNKQLFKESIILSQNLTQYFINIHNIEEAKYLLNITDQLIRSSQLHEIDKQQNFKLLQANHYWNNGMLLMAENKHLEAKDYFEKYYQYNPDPSTVLNLYSIYTTIGDHNKAEALFNKHSDALPCVKMIKDVSNNQKYTDLQLIKYFCYRDKHNIVIANLKLAISLNDEEHIESYRSILKHEVIAKKEEFNKISPEFQVEARLLLDNCVENVSAIIKKLDSDITSALFYKLSVLYSNGFNYDIALKYIDLAISYKSNYPLYLFHKHILEIYKELLDNLQESYPEKQAEIEHKELDEITLSNDEELQIEKRVPKEKTRPTQTLSSYDDIIDSYDPQKIDQYFKLSKKILLEQSINPVNKDKDAGWIINAETTIKLLDAINIFPNLYAAIDSSLKSDIDLSKWENILTKGFTSRKNAENGIKCLKHGIYEAKDCSNDVRLVASKTYINEDDQKLILFTKQMNHKEVTKHIGNTTCEEIYCANHNNELPLIGASSMDE